MLVSLLKRKILVNLVHFNSKNVSLFMQDVKSEIGWFVVKLIVLVCTCFQNDNLKVLQERRSWSPGPGVVDKSAFSDYIW